MDPNNSEVKPSERLENVKQTRSSSHNRTVSYPFTSTSNVPHASTSQPNSNMVSFYGNWRSGVSTGFSQDPQVSQDKTDDGSDLKGKVESRLLSLWNNMKYGWTVKIKTNFSKESPVWLLGRCYHRKLSPTDSVEGSTEIGTDATAQQVAEQLEGEGLEGFKVDFMSRLWLTYRREFPLLNGSNFTSDCGWGCMLRSGQMLLGQALMCHFLGRSWRWTSDQTILSARTYQEDCCHRMIIKWFGDKPSFNSPLSIHQLVTLGEAMGKKPGDWYGPGSVAYLLRSAVIEASKENYEFDDLCVYVAQDCAIYLQDIKEQCTKPNGAWKALIILVPVRLGAEKLNPIYGACLTAVLSLEYCIGIIGGKPKHSLYFVGYQDDKLIHLDPHYCQEVVDVWQPNFPVGSFHCRSPRKMPLLKMDPSCCIGFYCADQNEFNSFRDTVQPFLIPPNAASNSEYPMFVFTNGKGSDAQVPSMRYSILETDERWVSRDVNDSDTDMECEEFVIL